MRAEVGLAVTELEACRTLEGSGGVGAGDADTEALGEFGGNHGDGVEDVEEDEGGVLVVGCVVNFSSFNGTTCTEPH